MLFNVEIIGWKKIPPTAKIERGCEFENNTIVAHMGLKSADTITFMKIALADIWKWITQLNVIVKIHSLTKETSMLNFMRKLTKHESINPKFENRLINTSLSASSLSFSCNSAFQISLILI